MQKLQTPAPNDLSSDTFRDLASTRLDQTAPSLSGDAMASPSDFDLNPAAASEFDVTPLRQAAVLVPIVARHQPTVLLTQRTDHLPVHRGQISFPGGKLEPTGESATEAALREAHEEVSLSPGEVDVLGFLDAYRTATGYVIAPVVGLIQPGFTPVPEPTEVADVFEVPLSFLLNPDNHRVEQKVYKNKSRQFYAMPYEGRYIWGATAGILRNLYKRLYGSCSE